MVQKYQNEIAPIFYYGISTKTIEKDLKIPILQPFDWKHPYWMTLYNTTGRIIPIKWELKLVFLFYRRYVLNNDWIYGYNMLKAKFR